MPARSCGISIHALREEGDLVIHPTKTPMLYFYPRPPRGGRRFFQSFKTVSIKISIHALREEGDFFLFFLSGVHFISIHALREEGDVNRGLEVVIREISIHALREEGDAGNCALPASGQLFLSTPSARRATCAAVPGWGSCRDFYPRPPRGGRRFCGAAALPAAVFLSTPSARRAT